MGLAAVKVKQRFGLDPRNTKWANNTDRFGHQYMEKLGWKPGSGIGLVSHAVTSHVKVQLKDDTVGLGAKLSKKQKKDEFDSGECAGLDVFQRILGRLNGREDEISKELEIQRKDNIINGKWGVQFVRGDTLRSTWDIEAKKLLGNINKKRNRDDDEEEKSTEKKRKKGKKEKQEKREKKDKKEKSKDADKQEKKDKKDKKEKKEKKGKKEKKDKKEKKEQKEKVTRESMLKPSESREESPQVSTRLSVRSRWIKQKRAATMDAKALNEIFMITN